MGSYLPLTWVEVGVSALLLLLIAAASLIFRLGIFRRTVYAATRAFIQLALVGYWFGFVFSSESPLWVGVAVLIMFAVAVGNAYYESAEGRSELFWPISTALLASLLLVVVPTLMLVVPVERIWEPQYAIPLSGIVLGNTMTAVILFNDRMWGELMNRQEEVLGYLALGATPHQALYSLKRTAIRTALLPTINRLLTMGVVAVPGVLTGQLISGVIPIEAVKYQIVVLHMWAAGATVGMVSVALTASRQYFPLPRPANQSPTPN